MNAKGTPMNEQTAQDLEDQLIPEFVYKYENLWYHMALLGFLEAL